MYENIAIENILWSFNKDMVNWSVMCLDEAVIYDLNYSPEMKFNSFYWTLKWHKFVPCFNTSYLFVKDFNHYF